MARRQPPPKADPRFHHLGGGDPEFLAWVRRGATDPDYAKQFPTVDFARAWKVINTDLGRQILRELFQRRRTDPGDFAAAVRRMDAAVEAVEYAPLEAVTQIDDAFSEIITSSRRAAALILDTKEIPPNKRAAFEVAYRFVNGPMGLTRGRLTIDRVARMWQSNGHHFRTLVDGLAWPERKYARTGEAGGISRVGPFSVHDAARLTDAEKREMKESIQAAAEKIGAKGLPVRNVLYGDVFLVEQLQETRTLAWYNAKYDNLYVRKIRKGSSDAKDAVFAISHELGHRYWYITLPETTRLAWNDYYKELTQPGPLPNKGDTVWFVGQQYVVNAFARPRLGEQPAIILAPVNAPSRLQAASVKDFQRYVNFPTMYSETSSTELFAECYALYVLDRLREPWKSRFEALAINPFKDAGTSEGAGTSETLHSDVAWDGTWDRVC